MQLIKTMNIFIFTILFEKEFWRVERISWEHFFSKEKIIVVFIIFNNLVKRGDWLMSEFKFRLKFLGLLQAVAYRPFWPVPWEQPKLITCFPRNWCYQSQEFGNLHLYSLGSSWPSSTKRFMLNMAFFIKNFLEYILRILFITWTLISRKWL